MPIGANHVGVSMVLTSTYEREWIRVCVLSAGGSVTKGKEESSALPSRRRHIPIDPGSTLLVPGSIFVGSGLGMKKAPDVFVGRSSLVDDRD